MGCFKMCFGKRGVKAEYQKRIDELEKTIQKLQEKLDEKEQLEVMLRGRIDELEKKFDALPKACEVARVEETEHEKEGK